MEITTKTITLKGVDYREDDKMLLLYSLDYGKISVVAKGILKPNAKLKFFQQPFCFADTSIIQTGNKFTLKTAEQIESFFELGQNIEAYYCAIVVAEVLAICEPDEQPNAQVFLLALKTLKLLLEQKNDSVMLLCKFLMNYIKLSGYGLNFEICNVCKSRLDERQTYFDRQRSEVVCVACKTNDAILISPACKNYLKLIDNFEFEQLSRLSFTNKQQKDVLKFLATHVACNFANLKSITELLSTL